MELVRRAVTNNRSVRALVNNRAEGNAPLTHLPQLKSLKRVITVVTLTIRPFSSLHFRLSLVCWGEEFFIL